MTQIWKDIHIHRPKFHHFSCVEMIHCGDKPGLLGDMKEDCVEWEVMA